MSANSVTPWWQLGDISLRDYQKEAVITAIDEMRKEQSALVVGSTGLGKTEVIFGTIKRILELNPQIKFIILVNKVDLLKQTIKRLEKAIPHVAVGAYCGSVNQKNLHAQIIVASIQSLSNTMIMTDVIIVDETHAVNSDSGQYIDFINNCFQLNRLTKVFALTATPFRNDGHIYGEGKLFKRICFQRGLKWSIDNGFLVPPKLKYTKEQFDISNLKVKMGEYIGRELAELVDDKEKLNKQLDDALPKLSERKKVIWACASIKHCEDLTEALIERGEKASKYHSKQDKCEAQQELYSFENEDTKHLVFVTIVSEGYNHPPIDAIVLMRPTRSPRLAIQIIGRGLRPYSTIDYTKNDCLVLDYGRVIENIGPLDNPNIVVDKKNKKSEVTIAMRFCPLCYEYQPINQKYCIECDHEFEIQERDYQKNLSSKSTFAELLSKPIKSVATTRLATHIKIYAHKAKNGNNCFRIQYYCVEPNQMKICEYFNRDNDAFWARQSIRTRFTQLGASLIKLVSASKEPNELLWESDCKDKFELITKSKDGYERVNKVKRI